MPKKTLSFGICTEIIFFQCKVFLLFIIIHLIQNTIRITRKMSQLKKMLLKIIYSVIFNLGVVSRNLFSSHSSGIFIVNAAFNKPLYH